MVIKIAELTEVSSNYLKNFLNLGDGLRHGSAGGGSDTGHGDPSGSSTSH